MIYSKDLADYNFNKEKKMTEIFSTGDSVRGIVRRVDRESKYIEISISSYIK
ncbi:MAG: hypothetical protein HQK92_07825 [Nitrospirae bacterium]|nr:hypothetical protein [Nitrospirota bacterium]